MPRTRSPRTSAPSGTRTRTAAPAAPARVPRGIEASRASGIAFAAVALAHLAAGLQPDPRTWGLHALSFLPRSAWIAALAVLGAAAVPALAERVARFAEAVGRRAAGSRAIAAWLALAMAPLFWALRPDAQFLGDGVVWIEKLTARQVFHHFEPLATAVVRGVALGFESPERAAGLPSVVLGAAFVFVTALLCRGLWEDPRARGTAWLLLLVNPALLLFFGYVESYPLLLVLQALFALALVESARGRLSPWFAAALLALAIASHLQAVAWAPALLALSRVRGSGSVSWRRAAAQAAALSIASLAGAAALVRAVGASPRALLADLSGESGLGSLGASWFFSWQHAADLANELLLVLGAFAVIALAAPGRRHAREAALPRPGREWLPIAALLPGPLLFWIAVRPRIGGARDWDLYLGMLLPAGLLAVQAWSRTAGSASRAAAGRALVLAGVVTAAWLAVHLDAPRGARRLEVLQDPRGTFGAFARGYANETLGMFYRDRDLQAANAAYTRAVQANPKNARYYNNLANTELRLNRLAPARDAFASALALGMNEWYVLYNLGLCELQLQRPEEAERRFDQLLRDWPKRWEGLALRGQARLDQGKSAAALDDLQRALGVRPDDAELHYLAGLALRDLGRPAEARAALERALQLDPRHVRARAALEALPAAAP